MDPIEELKTEHRAVEHALLILERAAGKIPAEEPDLEALDRLVEFFTVFVDRCHHGKEERFLFPAVEAKASLSRPEFVGELIREHEQGRNLVTAMQHAAAGVRAKDEKAPALLAEAAASYAGLLRQHIEKEDEDLFPAAADQLTASRKSALTERFERIETEEVGEGRHEAFHRMLEKLGGRYGV